MSQGTAGRGTTSFDRVRVRAVGERQAPPAVDAQGKAALFSRASVGPTLGTVVISCSQCRQDTSASYLRALRLAIPSLHLVLLPLGHPSWMRCPACGRRTWVRVRFM